LISSVIGIKLNVLKAILFFFLGPLTGFSFWVAAYWSIELRKKYIYSECSIKDATHFFIINWDNSYSIAERIVIPLIEEISKLRKIN
jgi:hypothetical protein